MNKMIVFEKYDDYDLKNLILIKNKQCRNVEKTNEVEFSDDDSKYVFIKTSFLSLIRVKKTVEKIINDVDKNKNHFV